MGTPTHPIASAVTRPLRHHARAHRVDHESYRLSPRIWCGPSRSIGCFFCFFFTVSDGHGPIRAAGVISKCVKFVGSHFGSRYWLMSSHGTVCEAHFLLLFQLGHLLM